MILQSLNQQSLVILQESLGGAFNDPKDDEEEEEPFAAQRMSSVLNPMASKFSIEFSKSQVLPKRGQYRPSTFKSMVQMNATAAPGGSKHALPQIPKNPMSMKQKIEQARNQMGFRNKLHSQVHNMKGSFNANSIILEHKNMLKKEASKSKFRKGNPRVEEVKNEDEESSMSHFTKRNISQATSQNANLQIRPTFLDSDGSHRISIIEPPNEGEQSPYQKTALGTPDVLEMIPESDQSMVASNLNNQQTLLLPSQTQRIKRKRSSANLLKGNLMAMQAINQTLQKATTFGPGGGLIASPTRDQLALSQDDMDFFGDQDNINDDKLQNHTDKALKMQEKLYDSWRMYDIIASIIAIVGLTIAIFSHERDLSHQFDLKHSSTSNNTLTIINGTKIGQLQEDTFGYIEQIDQLYYKEGEQQQDVFLVIVTALTVISCILMALRHVYMAKWKLQLYKFLLIECMLRPIDNARQQQLKSLDAVPFYKDVNFYIDMAMMMIQPVPFLQERMGLFNIKCIDITNKSSYINVEYNINQIFLAFMFLRIIFIVRSLLNYSKFIDQNAKKLLSDNYGFYPDVQFTLKCLIQMRPELTVSIILAMSVMVISYILRLFEITYYRAINQLDMEQFIQPVWAVVITMGTVGFGDVVPVSPIGRIIMMITSIWGAFMFSLVLVAFSMIFNMSPHQKKAMHHLLLSRKAASTIALAFRFFTARKMSKNQLQHNPQLKEIFQRKISFSHLDQDLKRLKIDMEENMRDFKEERIHFKKLKMIDGNEQRKNIKLIKTEVLNIAHAMKEMQEKFFGDASPKFKFGDQSPSGQSDQSQIIQMLKELAEAQQEMKSQITEQNRAITNLQTVIVSAQSEEGDDYAHNNDLQFEANFDSEENHPQGGESGSVHALDMNETGPISMVIRGITATVERITERQETQMTNIQEPSMRTGDVDGNIESQQLKERVSTPTAHSAVINSVTKKEPKAQRRMTAFQRMLEANRRSNIYASEESKTQLNATKSAYQIGGTSNMFPYFQNATSHISMKQQHAPRGMHRGNSGSRTPVLGGANANGQTTSKGKSSFAQYLSEVDEFRGIIHNTQNPPSDFILPPSSEQQPSREIGIRSGDPYVANDEVATIEHNNTTSAISMQKGANVPRTQSKDYHLSKLNESGSGKQKQLRRILESPTASLQQLYLHYSEENQLPEKMAKPAFSGSANFNNNNLQLPSIPNNKIQVEDPNGLIVPQNALLSTIHQNHNPFNNFSFLQRPPTKQQNDPPIIIEDVNLLGSGGESPSGAQFHNKVEEREVGCMISNEQSYTASEEGSDSQTHDIYQ
ncbi:hypothetical protein FGO68_gene1800 [Halteria grandinella]|uniref:Potassium channel domain-containing protein n=1 Tax=Halteria grandinella TaxID=5974 RepID=A0A8J8P403_HALGN|nr:hypothetical protein FGO68_gene1800 [Halteria grandinella]